MSDLVLQFVTEKDPVSAAIRYFSHGLYSHVDGVLPSGELLGAHASGGVAIRKPDYSVFSAKLRIRIATDKADAIYARALKEVGKPYDFEAIAGFAFGRDWRDAAHWFCSELWLWCIEAEKFFGRPLVMAASTVTPVELALLLSPFGEVIG